MPDDVEALSEEKRLGLIEAGIEFWFNDNEKVRSPIPKAMQPQVKRKATEEYHLWLSNMTDADRDDVKEDELVEVFEALLFGEALKLIGKDDEDLALTLYHPFMPRVGDVVNDAKHGASRITARKVEPNEDKKPFMIVTLESVDSHETWQTEFALPP